MLYITDITINELRDNKFKKEFPELYELKDVIENNSWHINEDVFSHTISVLTELDNLFKKNFFISELYFEKRVNNNTRKDLLFLATLFHDIGKKYTLEKIREITYSPKHEEVGSISAVERLDIFDLSKLEKELIVNTIKNHSVIHLLLNYRNFQLKEKIEQFKKDYDEIFLELIFLGLADTLGSQLKKTQPKDFEFRIQAYETILAQYNTITNI